MSAEKTNGNEMTKPHIVQMYPAVVFVRIMHFHGHRIHPNKKKTLYMYVCATHYLFDFIHQFDICFEKQNQENR